MGIGERAKVCEGVKEPLIMTVDDACLVLVMVMLILKPLLDPDVLKIPSKLRISKTDSALNCNSIFNFVTEKCSS